MAPHYKRYLVDPVAEKNRVHDECNALSTYFSFRSFLCDVVRFGLFEVQLSRLQSTFYILFYNLKSFLYTVNINAQHEFDRGIQQSWFFIQDILDLSMPRLILIMFEKKTHIYFARNR